MPIESRHATRYRSDLCQQMELPNGGAFVSSRYTCAWM